MIVWFFSLFLAQFQILLAKISQQPCQSDRVPSPPSRLQATAGLIPEYTPTHRIYVVCNWPREATTYLSCILVFRLFYFLYAVITGNATLHDLLQSFVFTHVYLGNKSSIPPTSQGISGPDLSETRVLACLYDLVEVSDVPANVERTRKYKRKRKTLHIVVVVAPLLNRSAIPQITSATHEAQRMDAAHAPCPAEDGRPSGELHFFCCSSVSYAEMS